MPRMMILTMPDGTVLHVTPVYEFDEALAAMNAIREAGILRDYINMPELLRSFDKAVEASCINQSTYQWGG